MGSLLSDNYLLKDSAVAGCASSAVLTRKAVHTKAGEELKTLTSHTPSSIFHQFHITSRMRGITISPKQASRHCNGQREVSSAETHAVVKPQMDLSSKLTKPESTRFFALDVTWL